MKVTLMIQKSIDELKAITKVDLCVLDAKGTVIATTMQGTPTDKQLIRSFISSPADAQKVGQLHLLKILDEDELVYLVVASGATDDTHTIGKIALSQINNLRIAFKEKIDINNFYQNLLLDNLLLIDIYNRAKQLNIENNKNRVIFLIQIKEEKDDIVTDLLKSIFGTDSGNFVTSIDEHSIILIKQIQDDVKPELITEVADMIVSMVNTEVMINVKVSFGTVVSELKDVSKSYKEAKVALEVGEIFYESKDVIGYNMLGIGRLIYQLPDKLCRLFLKEIFGAIEASELDEETYLTVEKFYENDLNIAETSRQLFVHRNTLGNRLDRLEEKIGLDIRKFDDALTLKLALMVASYIKYLDLQE